MVSKEAHNPIHDFIGVRELHPDPLKKYVPQTVEVVTSKWTYMSPEDVEYWSYNPPEEIIVASGSNRKATMFALLLGGLRFPLPEGDELAEIAGESDPNSPHVAYRYLSKYMHNGDGSFEGKQFLCYYKGVPVYAEYRPGETDDNEPERQALNKINSLVSEYQGRDVILLATDAVDGPTEHFLELESAEEHPNYPREGSNVDKYWFELVFSDLKKYAQISENRRRNGAVFLGKPMKLEHFPSANDLTDEPLLEREATYLYWYERVINADTRFEHTNGIAAIRTSDPFGVRHLTTIDLLTIPNGKHGKANKDVGGGGLTQQFFDWQDRDSLLNALDEKSRKKLEHMSLEQLQFTVYAQIAGMPAWALLTMIEGLASNRAVTEKVLFEASKT